MKKMVLLLVIGCMLIVGCEDKEPISDSPVIQPVTENDYEIMAPEDFVYSEEDEYNAELIKETVNYSDSQIRQCVWLLKNNNCKKIQSVTLVLGSDDKYDIMDEEGNRFTANGKVMLEALFDYQQNKYIWVVIE